MMNPCRNDDCMMPRWRDGIEPLHCVGHQQVNPPVYVQHPNTGEVLELHEEETACWECGAEPPRSMALVDTDMMAGELWCAECIRKGGTSGKVTAHVRLDDEGDNY